MSTSSPEFRGDRPSQLPQSIAVSEETRSAQRILIRRKLLEKKRFDSADLVLENSTTKDFRRSERALNNGSSSPPHFGAATQVTLSPPHTGDKVYFNTMTTEEAQAKRAKYGNLCGKAKSGIAQFERKPTQQRRRMNREVIKQSPSLSPCAESLVDTATDEPNVSQTVPPPFPETPQFMVNSTESGHISSPFIPFHLGRSNFARLYNYELSGEQKSTDSTDFEMKSDVAALNSTHMDLVFASNKKPDDLNKPCSMSYLAGQNGAQRNYNAHTGHNMLVKKKLKQKKRFDSADHFMAGVNHKSS